MPWARALCALCDCARIVVLVSASYSAPACVTRTYTDCVVGLHTRSVCARAHTMQVSGFWWRDWNTVEGFDLLWKGYSELWIGWTLINYGAWYIYIIYFGKNWKRKFIITPFCDHELMKFEKWNNVECVRKLFVDIVIIQFCRVFGRTIFERKLNLSEKKSQRGRSFFSFPEEEKKRKKLVKYCCRSRWFFCWLGFKGIIY